MTELQQSFVWIWLVDEATGESLNGTFTPIIRSALVLPTVDHLQFAVFRDIKDEEPTDLTAANSGDFTVYKNRTSFGNRIEESPLEKNESIVTLGTRPSEALVVVVPSSLRKRKRVESNHEPSSTVTINQERCFFFQSPSRRAIQNLGLLSARKKRWHLLNEVLSENAGRNAGSSYCNYADIQWDQVKPIFKPSNYVQIEKDFDETIVCVLKVYFRYASACLGPMYALNSAKQKQLIAPLLICVCQFFDGNVELEIEEELNGKIVKAQGQFDFVVKKDKRVIPIVVAKNGDMKHALAKALVQCEVAAEIGEQVKSFGIVTDYCNWIFIRNFDDKIELEECTLELAAGFPVETSLKTILAKINAMIAYQDL